MYDAIVVGAGPGGATAAAFMAEGGLRVLLLDRQAFPRDKICGDAISGKSVDVLRRLGVLGAVMAAEQVGSWGVTFGGPYGDEVSIPAELHFVDETVPGYFWIFPMAGGGANVGVGMLSEVIKKRGIRLKDVLEACVAHPRFRARFARAHRAGPGKGWGLPLGSRPRPMAGPGWMLVGDAASLIDPFTGEGIGNAMVSGERAALWAQAAVRTADFSHAFLENYERDVMQYLRGELRLSHAMQRLINWKWLLNTVIRKASRSPELADTISCMFDDERQRRKLVSPLFYLRVLTA